MMLSGPHLAAVAKALPHSKWKRPVVVAIDEAQNMPGDENSPVGLLLQAFHESQANLPVIVLLAGLSDTKMRVRELGLSRLSKNRVCSLNGLDAVEVAELKAGFLRTILRLILADIPMSSMRCCSGRTGGRHTCRTVCRRSVKCI